MVENQQQQLNSLQNQQQQQTTNKLAQNIIASIDKENKCDPNLNMVGKKHSKSKQQQPQAQDDQIKELFQNQNEIKQILNLLRQNKIKDSTNVLQDITNNMNNSDNKNKNDPQNAKPQHNS